MAPAVYDDGKQFDFIEKLRKATVDVWQISDASYICGLFHRIHETLLAAIGSGNKEINYYRFHLF